MKNHPLPVILFALILLLSTACGTLEVGIESTATLDESMVRTEDPGPDTPTAPATRTPAEVQPDGVFTFNSYIHPRWGYQLPIPNGARIVSSPDELSTSFLYEDANLIRGAYNLSVDVLPETGADSPEELVQAMADAGIDIAPATTVEVDGGRLVGAAISYLLPQGGTQCAEMRVLDVAFIEAGTGYVLKIRSDAPDRCDAQALPETQGVLSSFRVQSSLVQAEETPAQEPTPVPLPTSTELRVAFVKDENVWLWQAGQEATALTTAGGVNSVEISDDGQLVAFVRGDELWVVDSAGGAERQLVSASAFAAMEPREPFEDEVVLNRFDWVPGTHLLAFNTRLRTEIGLVLNDDLHLVDADTLEQKLLLPPGEGGEFYYSPDGNTVAVVTAGRIQLLNADGENRREVFTYTPVVTYSEVQFYAKPAWAADSGSLRVVIPPADPLAQPSQPGTIWHIATDQPSARLLGNITAGPRGEFAFSPDLSQVAYLGLPEGASLGDQESLLVTNLDNGQTVTYFGQAYGLYGWAPDGGHFAFLSNPQLPQARIGALGADALPAHSDDQVAAIDMRWVDAGRYLFLAQSPGGWDIMLGEIGGSSTILATLAGPPPAYDFAAPATPAAGSSSAGTGMRVPTSEPSAIVIREQPKRCVV